MRDDAIREIDRGVEMEDIVQYALPFVKIGRVFGGPRIRRRIHYRNRLTHGAPRDTVLPIRHPIREGP